MTVRPGETTPRGRARDRRHQARPEITAQRASLGEGPAPSVFNMSAPTCTTLPPQAPHTIRNNSPIPLHYYRIEFKRVDGDDFPSHWREWYPWMKYRQNMRQGGSE